MTQSGARAIVRRTYLAYLARWTVLAVVLVLVVLPRFDLHDSGLVRKFTATATATRYGLPLDVAGYVRLVEYFRGELPADSLISPYCYRPLVPYVASKLPFKPLTSINAINLLCLFLSVMVLDGILTFVGYTQSVRNLGALLFLVSFPTFYYGTIGFVDPVAVLFVSVGVYLTLRGHALMLALCVVLGTLVKETNALIALLPGIWGWARASLSVRLIIQVAMLGFLALFTAVCVRTLSPFPERGWFWIPSLEAVRENLSRPRAYLSLFLTLGLPAALALVAVATRRAGETLSRPIFRFLLGGVSLVTMLYFYTLPAAYADGRVIWIVYPFLIPLALSVVPPARAAKD